MQIVFGSRLKFIYIIILCPVFAVTESIGLHYENGLEALRNNQYDLAIQEFETILDNNWDSPELYYNLGNAFYRNGNTSGSIWAYESCLRIFPNHSDAQYNLKLANLNVKDRVDLPDPPIYLKWYMGIKERYTPSIWVNITLFILLLLSITATVLRIFSDISLNYISGIFLTLFFCSLFFTLHSIWTGNSVSQGIIYFSSIEARSEPNSFSTRLFKVHEGLKVSVNQISENWMEIELLDGKVGWIEERQIRLIQ